MDYFTDTGPPLEHFQYKVQSGGVECKYAYIFFTLDILLSCLATSLSEDFNQIYIFGCDILVSTQILFSTLSK